MFRNWMRNRLGLDSNAPMGGNQMSPRTMGFENRPMGGNTEFGTPNTEGWTPRPQPVGPIDSGFGGGMGKGFQPEGWVPKENPYNPQTFAAVPDESYSSFGRRPGQAYSPFAW
ncbi:MAG: hypothetical protein WCO52_06220 [bacterium]